MIKMNISSDHVTVYKPSTQTHLIPQYVGARVSIEKAKPYTPYILSRGPWSPFIIRAEDHGVPIAERRSTA